MHILDLTPRALTGVFAARLCQLVSIHCVLYVGTKSVCVCLSDSAMIIAFKMTSSVSMIVCTQKSLCLFIIEMNADDGSTFFKKLLLVIRLLL